MIRIYLSFIVPHVGIKAVRYSWWNIVDNVSIAQLYHEGKRMFLFTGEWVKDWVRESCRIKGVNYNERIHERLSDCKKWVIKLASEPTHASTSEQSEWTKIEWVSSWVGVWVLLNPWYVWFTTGVCNTKKQASTQASAQASKCTYPRAHKYIYI